MDRIGYKPLEFQDYIAELYPELIVPSVSGADRVLSKSVTFQVTDACNLACTYCYQINKGTRKMSFETAKKFVDLLLSGDKGFDTYVGVDKSPAIILEFIGGEPLLEVELIDKIIDYFRSEAIRLNHPWAEKFICSISSNGTLYWKPEVQRFLQKHKSHLSYSVSIDGNKELHDACRVFPDGSPSYDLAMSGVKDWMSKGYYMGSKITVAPQNVSHIFEASKHMIEEGYTDININCVYEEGWNIEHAKILYNQLKMFADYLLKKDNVKNIYYAYFNEEFYKPQPPEDNDNYCGGTGVMLSCDPDGRLFPCIRYMESSLGTEQPPVVIGTVDEGIAQTECTKKCVNCLQCITRRSQSTDECFYCPISVGCGWCFESGTKVSTPNGLTNIEDIQVGDIVYDKDGVEREVIRATSHIANNLTIIHAAGYPDVIVTKEHPYYVKRVIKRNHNIPTYSEPQWIPAGELKVSDKIGLFVPSFEDGIDFPKELAYIVGRYIGDGWKTNSGRKKTPYRYYICCNDKEKDKLERVLQQSNVGYYVMRNKTVWEFKLHTSSDIEKQLISIIDKCGCYAINKDVPREVWTWNKESVKSLLDGYFDADGSLKHNIQRYCSINKNLIFSIAELVRGVYHKNVSITYRKSNKDYYIEGRKVTCHDSYEGRFLLSEPKKKYYEYDEKNNIMWVNISTPTLKNIPKKLEVFNIEVKDNPTFIANGALVHNCSAYNYQKFGTANKRATYICDMHKAASLANVYFWNKLYKQLNIDKKFKMNCPKEWAIPIIGEDEYNYLFNLSN